MLNEPRHIPRFDRNSQSLVILSEAKDLCNLPDRAPAAVPTPASNVNLAFQLRHASPATTTTVYSQPIEGSVKKAVNSYEETVYAARPKPPTLKRVK